MGGMISRWRRKPSTVEVLDKLNKDIESMEKMKRSNLERQKHMIGSLVLYSVVAYIGAALLFYFYYLPDKLVDRFIYSSPLLIFPVLVMLLKKFLHWYFVNRISKNDSKLEDLREKKKSILEEVMEKETYKKAKEILEKFDPERFKKMEPDKVTTPGPQRPTDGTELRNRSMAGQPTPGPGSALGPAATPRPPPGQAHSTPGAPPMSAARMSLQNNGQQRMMTPIPMPRPILPRERTTADRLVEYLIGDGPANRYALICRQCKSHNGMALKEEFEFLAFRCCYCYTENGARRQRPVAPKLESTPLSSRRRLTDQMLEPTDSQEQEQADPVTNPAAAAANEEEEAMEVADNDTDIAQAESSLVTSKTESRSQEGPSEAKDSESKKRD